MKWRREDWSTDVRNSYYLTRRWGFFGHVFALTLEERRHLRRRYERGVQCDADREARTLNGEVPPVIDALAAYTYDELNAEIDRRLASEIILLQDQGVTP